jgi:hypothetical protein
MIGRLAAIMCLPASFRGAGLAALCLVLLVIAGCASSVNRQVEALRRPSGEAQIVLMPLDVALFELSAGGVPEPRADWTEAAKVNLDAAFDAERDTLGLRLAKYDESGVSSEAIDRLYQIQKLHGAVGQAIMLHHYTPQYALPSKKGRFDWTLGPSLTVLREATGADYALFTHVNDSYSSAGRVAVIVFAALFGVSVPGGQQIGFASLVDLQTGEIAWFNFMARGWGDLRTPEAARGTAKELLTGFPK